MKKFNKIMNLIMIFSLTFCAMIIAPINVNAAYDARISTDGVRFRQNPSTKNSDILDTLNTNTKISVIEDKKYSGEGCDEGWFKINYNNREGYVCSKYVTTQSLDNPYDRPWNTPKKAIVGGAKWIANGYIAKGQFTSYLKKFNVNPNGYYSIYSHLYQSNITAPSTEAVSSSTSYYKNNSFNLPFSFSIPVYENMAQSYLHPKGKKANLGTTSVTDDAFENMIKDFPDSYKPYLRQLHQEHNNWTFTPMRTGVSIEEASNIFKETGAIQSTDCALVECSGGNAIGTGEAGWYKPNQATTAYYLDPRNFLNESYVFMFENLSYIDISESVIQGVLNRKSYVSGTSSIDNQSFASMFLEAGKVANVNPVYLASLSVQEIGEFNTTGQQFEYKGTTYSGLFNFYNIGASSSAENPVKAGLVYASGGLCTICATYTNNNTSNNSSSNSTADITSQVNNIGGSLKDNYIRGFNVGSSVDEIKSKDSSIQINGDGLIKTGQTMTLANGQTYTVIVYGDTNGDGQINSADLLKIRQYLLGKVNLSDAEKEAANFAGDNNVNSASLLKVRQYLLGKANIPQK